MNHESFFLFFITLLAAALLTRLADAWIRRLYEAEPDALSFPEAVAARSRWRRPALLLFYVGALHILTPEISSPSLPYLVLAVFFLGLVTLTDFEQYVIFDRVLLPFALCGLLATIHLGAPLAERLLTAAAGGAAFFLMAVLTRGGIGGGDVKLIAALGLWLGPDRLLTTVTRGFLAGGLVVFILLLTKKKHRDSFVAYGPYFALTALWLLLTGGITPTP